jgi:hypothetical protein
MWESRGLDDVRCRNNHPAICAVEANVASVQETLLQDHCLTTTEREEMSSTSDAVYTGCYALPSRIKRLYEDYPTHWVHVAFRYQILQVANTGAHAFGFRALDHKQDAAPVFLKVPITFPAHHHPDSEIAISERLQKYRACDRVLCLRDWGRFRKYYYMAFDLVEGLSFRSLLDYCPEGVCAFLCSSACMCMHKSACVLVLIVAWPSTPLNIPNQKSLCCAEQNRGNGLADYGHDAADTIVDLN